jgi:ParB family chromosome partitioning protein
MSIKDRADGILSAVGGSLNSGQAPRRSVGAPAAATAVGGMVGQGNNSLRERLERAESEVAALKEDKERLSALAEQYKQELAEGKQLIYVDPARVRHSRFADRHPAAFRGKEFDDFCELIKASKGNNEPGRVRPVTDDPDFDYELVSGHRRHAACLRGSFRFWTLMGDYSDLELTDLMHTENLGRKNLSAFENGRKYALQLKEGMYPSVNAIAAKYQVPFSVMQRLVQFDLLTDEVIKAFPDPRVIRFPWISPLLKAREADPKGFDAIVAEIQGDSSLKPQEIFHRLTGKASQHGVIASKNKVLGRRRQIHGCPAVVLNKDAPVELLNMIEELIVKYADEHGVST